MYWLIFVSRYIRRRLRVQIIYAIFNSMNGVNALRILFMLSRNLASFYKILYLIRSYKKFYFIKIGKKSYKFLANSQKKNSAKKALPYVPWFRTFWSSNLIFCLLKVNSPSSTRTLIHSKKARVRVMTQSGYLFISINIYL